jgi:hypothetical protein
MPRRVGPAAWKHLKLLQLLEIAQPFPITDFAIDYRFRDHPDALASFSTDGALCCNGPESTGRTDSRSRT